MRASFIVALGGMTAFTVLAGGCPHLLPAPDETGAATGGTGTGGREATTCPGHVPLTLSVISPPPPTYGEPGCASDGGETLRAAAEVVSGNTLRFLLQTGSGLPFSEPGRLEVYEGDNPSCTTPAGQTALREDEVVKNQSGQVIDLPLSVDDPTWPVDGTRTFWVMERVSNGPRRATNAVVVTKGCCRPKVLSVTPSEATMCAETQFVISGECLPDTLTFWIPQCMHGQRVDHSLTQAIFTCTPCTCDTCTTGPRSGVVKDYPCGTSPAPPETLYEPEVNILPSGTTCACPDLPFVDPCKQ